MSVVVFIFYQFFSATYTHVLLYLCRRGFLSFVRSFRFVVIYYVVEWRRQREAKSKKELCTHSFWHKHKTDHCVRGIFNKNKTYMYRWRPQATISRRSMMMHMFTLWRSTGKKKACRKYTSKRNFSSETGSETMFFFVLFALSNGTHIIMVWHYPQTLCVLCVYHRVYCARFFSCYLCWETALFTNKFPFGWNYRFGLPRSRAIVCSVCAQIYMPNHKLAAWMLCLRCIKNSIIKKSSFFLSFFFAHIEKIKKKS